MWLTHRMIILSSAVTFVMSLPRHFRSSDVGHNVESLREVTVKWKRRGLPSHTIPPDVLHTLHTPSKSAGGQVPTGLQKPGAAGGQKDKTGTARSRLRKENHTDITFIRTDSSEAVRAADVHQLALFAIFFIAVIVGFVVLLCVTSDFSSESSRQPSDQKQQQQTPAMPSNVVEAKHHKTKDDAALAVPSANTKANLLKLEADENAQGTWVNTYRKADMSSREALELLFRCNIIPMDEFGENYVSQEHIDECVWISTQMLRQKSLDEWVAMWPQATKTFEESVTACFAARTDVLASLYGNSEPGTPGSTTTDLREIVGANRTATDLRQSSISPNLRETSPASDRGVMDCRTPGVPSPATAQQAPAAVTRSYPGSLNTMTSAQAAPVHASYPTYPSYPNSERSLSQSTNPTYTPPGSSPNLGNVYVRQRSTTPPGAARGSNVSTNKTLSGSEVSFSASPGLRNFSVGPDAAMGSTPPGTSYMPPRQGSTPPTTGLAVGATPPGTSLDALRANSRNARAGSTPSLGARSTPSSNAASPLLGNVSPSNLSTPSPARAGNGEDLRPPRTGTPGSQSDLQQSVLARCREIMSEAPSPLRDARSSSTDRRQEPREPGS